MAEPFLDFVVSGIAEKAGRYDETKHPRNPKGDPKGGKWRKSAMAGQDSRGEWERDLITGERVYYDAAREAEDEAEDAARTAAVRNALIPPTRPGTNPPHQPSPWGMSGGEATVYPRTTSNRNVPSGALLFGERAYTSGEQREAYYATRDGMLWRVSDWSGQRPQPATWNDIARLTGDDESFIRRLLERWMQFNQTYDVSTKGYAERKPALKSASAAEHTEGTNVTDKFMDFLLPGLAMERMAEKAGRYDETKHPRKPKGDPQGGKFADKPGAGDDAPKRAKPKRVKGKEAYWPQTWALPYTTPPADAEHAARVQKYYEEFKKEWRWPTGILTDADKELLDERQDKKFIKAFKSDPKRFAISAHAGTGESDMPEIDIYDKKYSSWVGVHLEPKRGRRIHKALGDAFKPYLSGQVQLNAKAYDESKHRRKPKGDPQGGQYAEKPGFSQQADAMAGSTDWDSPKKPVDPAVAKIETISQDAVRYYNATRKRMGFGLGEGISPGNDYYNKQRGWGTWAEYAFLRREFRGDAVTRKQANARLAFRKNPKTIEEQLADPNT